MESTDDLDAPLWTARPDTFTGIGDTDLGAPDRAHRFFGIVEQP